MSRAIKKVGLYAVILCLGLIPIVAALITYNAGVVFHSHAGGGDIDFSFNFTSSGTTYSGSFVIFANLNPGDYWGGFGISCPASIDTTITLLNSSSVSLNTTGAGSLGIYTPLRGAPDIVTGATYVYDVVLETLTLQVSGTDNPVFIDYGSEIHFVPNDSDDFIPYTGAPDLIIQYFGTGDFIGFIFSSYTQILGTVFFVILGLIMSIPIYSRLGAVPTVLFLMVAAYGFVQVLPPQAIGFIRIVVVIALGLVTAVVFLSRRRAYA